MLPVNEKLLNIIRAKGALNNEVMNNALIVFGQLKSFLQHYEKNLRHEAGNDVIKIQYTDRGTYEAELKVADDVLIFILHTSAFVFDATASISKTGYVTEDKSRATCGMISVYNFLTDSIKFERNHDIGQLIGRIFVNRENHFFVEGKKQIGVLYNDYKNAVMTEENMQAVVESFLQFAVEIDNQVPPFDMMKEITVIEARTYTIQNAVDAGKRLGFKFQNENTTIES
jgi:hypothetical protein